MQKLHFTNHDFDEWDGDTKGMTLVQEAIYLRLKKHYYRNSTEQHGKIDASDFDILCFHLGVSQNEINDLNTILKAHFKKTGNTYRHTEWDKDIKNIRWAMKKGGNGGNETGNEQGNGSNESGNAMSNAERQAKLKAERKKITQDLQNAGIEFDKNLAISSLRELHAKRITQTDNEPSNESGNKIGNGGNEVSNEQGNASNAEKLSNTNNKDNNKDNNIKNKYANEVAEVFEFWKSIFGKTEQTILTDKRKAKIIGRLKDGYTVEQIKQAIYNCSRSDYHVSNNYIDVELICRDVEKIDRFLGLTEQVRNQAKSSHQPFGGVHDPLAVNQVWEQRQATGRSALDDLRDMGINVQEGVTIW